MLAAARPGDRFQDSHGALWEYVTMAGVSDALFPYLLRCIDTDRFDQFTVDGYDAVLEEYRRHPLVLAV